MKFSLFRAALTLTGLTLFASACTSQPVLLPSRDFDRPSDVSFVCIGAFGATGAGDGGVDGGGALVTSGQPMRVCHPRGKIDPTPGVGGRTFAFVPNSSSGDLTVLDADRWALVNLDPANPNFNRLPLGVLPSQMSASDDGCRLVTANHGSCDLSLVDPAALLAPTLARETPGVTIAPPPGSTVVKNITPITPSGRPLHVNAGEVAFLPEDPSSAGLCDDDPNHQWKALVTFPSCDLVAVLDLPSGQIQKAAYARTAKSGGVEMVPLAAGEDPICPVDCLYQPTSAGAATTDADAGAAAPAATPDGGESGAALPSTLAIEPQNGRAFVGFANAPYVLAFNVSDTRLDTPTVIPLAEDALGVDRVRLSIDPYKDKFAGGKAGDFVGDDPSLDSNPAGRSFVSQRQYLYVVARDGSLRVVSVTEPTKEAECETNTDFSAISDPNAKAAAMNAACPPILGPAKRRPGAVGPGLRFPTPPVDVAVADVRPTPSDQSETSVTGAHAWVLTASGSVYMINIDPVPRLVAWVTASTPLPVTGAAPTTLVQPCATMSDCKTEPDPAPNTVRNRGYVGYSVSLDPSLGLPRLDVEPSQPALGARIESLWTLGTEANATAQTSDFIQTQVFFPDPTAAAPQTWTVTWEGILTGSPRYSGQVLQTGALRDLGADFCRLNVENRDIVTLLGCTDTSQCGLGKECVLGSNGAVGASGLAITGLCLSPDERNDCGALLSTVRRYDVSTTNRTELGLTPHIDELARRPDSPCKVKPMVTDGGVDARRDGATTDAGGGVSGDAGVAAQDGSAASLPSFDDCADPTDPTTAGFSCIAGRCLYSCKKPNDTSECRAGRICLAFGDPAKKCDDATNPCYCADGPPLTSASTNAPACLGELLPYQVSVGRGFLVSGTTTGIPATRMADSTGACVPIPNLDERVNIRVPIDAPICQNVGNLPGDSGLDSRCNPNLTVPGCPSAATRSDALITASRLQNILMTRNEPTSCVFPGGFNETDAANATQPHLRALFRNREVEFMMTNLERPPSGSQQIRFDVHGGFQAQTVAIPSTVEVTMPTRIVIGPFDSNPPNGGVGTATSEVPYLFVVDQRRLGRSQGGGPTRGQLLRIHPRGFVISTPVAGYQPWFEDLNHSANLFPIQ